MLLRLAPLVLGGLLLSACASAVGVGDQELRPTIVVEDSVETPVDDEFDRALPVSPGSLEASEGDRGSWPIIVLEDPAETTLVDDEFDRASLVYPGSLEASERAEGDEGAGETFRLYSTADDLDAVLSYYEELGIGLTADVEGLSHVAIVRGGGHLVFLIVRQETERVVIELSGINLAEAMLGSEP